MKHLACIMDGNRRWAKEQGHSFIVGYQQGLKTVELAIDFCITKNITYLSLFVFSLQNVKRSTEEKDIIFMVMQQAVDEALRFVQQRNVRVFFSGNLTLFSDAIQQMCEHVQEETKQATGLQLTLLFGYGGQEDIIQAVQHIAYNVEQGIVNAQEVTHEMLLSYLWTKHVPVPDLIIRTGNIKRLSNFFLYQAAYSELYFVPVMWPAVTIDHFEDAYTFFVNTKRNFGV
jgi:undecaprenyl diphosphate synthase